MEFLAPSLRRASLEVLRNGASEVLPCGVFRRMAFDSRTTLPIPEFSFGYRAEAHRGVLLAEVPALTSGSLPSGRMLAGAFRFLHCGAAHGAVFHRGLLREPSSVSSGRPLEVRQSGVVLRGGLTEASGG